MALDSFTYRSLLDLIDKQIFAYQDYLNIQEKEREALKKSRISELKSCTVERSNALEHIMIVKTKIVEILSSRGENKISRYINKNGSDEQKKVLNAKIKNLRDLVKCTQGRAREFSELLDFSSNFVNGSLSILWSATQGIFKSYGKDGNIHQSYHPNKFFKDRTL